MVSASRVDVGGRQEGLPPRYCKLFTTHTLPYINAVLWFPVFFFGFLTFDDGSDKLSRSVDKDLTLLAA